MKILSLSARVRCSSCGKFLPFGGANGCSDCEDISY